MYVLELENILQEPCKNVITGSEGERNLNDGADTIPCCIYKTTVESTSAFNQTHTHTDVTYLLKMRVGW
jgi:hypothetical protein